MLTTECSFCKKKNVPGTRFCAECGSPMHLKVCPNVDCGKVSDAKATVCSSCGQTFPAIDLVPPGTRAPPAARPDRGPAAPVTQLKRANDKPPINARPLIMVAIVAGGLPLLWANRAYLPLPKTWQSSPSPSAPVMPAAPAVPVAPAAIPAPTPTPPSAAIAPPGQAGTPAAEAVAPLAKEAVETPAASAEEPAAAAKTTSRAEKKAKPRSSGNAQESGPCTDAKAALGLCGPAKSGK
jgi:hypothetical protein